MISIDIFGMLNKIKALKAVNDVRKGNFEQVIVVNKKLNMSESELANQVANASILSFLNANNSLAVGWLDNSASRVIFKVDSAQDLLDLRDKADDLNIPNILVINEENNGAITCLGIGPSTKEIIDEITGDLRLL